MPVYIHQLKNWPSFHWEQEKFVQHLAEVRHQQGRILGRMEGMGFELQAEANLRTITQDVIKSSEIEGEILNSDQVRSSVARRLGMDIAGLVPSERKVEGVVKMMLDATRNNKVALTHERLFKWHALMFPPGKTGMHKFVVGGYRDNDPGDPMQVVSGPIGREKVHFEAPPSRSLRSEMKKFIDWFNKETSIDPVIKAAVAHLWFVTIHPFDDGNGRMARAITDMQLSRADKSQQRFYSMSSQIRIDRKSYYDILEKTQKGSLDITDWIEWFLLCLHKALTNTTKQLSDVVRKARFWDENASVSFNDRQKLMLNKLLDGFEGKLTSSKWATITKTSQDTANRDINDLIEKGILVKEPAGGRSTGYRLREF